MEIRDYRVFYLDPEEDINGLLNELGQSNAEKIALVVHRRSNIFNSRINLQLLQRYLREWQKELVFVSPEERLIRLVLETNLKIYTDIKALQDDEPITSLEGPLVTSLPAEELIPEKPPILGPEHAVSVPTDTPMYRSRRRQRSAFRRGAAVLFGLVILVALAWFYVGFNVVTIEVSPRVQQLEKHLELTGVDGLKQIQANQAKIPVDTFKLEVNDNLALPTTGKKRVGNTTAQGHVTLVNNQRVTVQVPAGTVLQTSSGIKFKTVNSVTVPKLTHKYAGRVSLGTVNGQADVDIVALTPGSEGNVKAWQIVRFANASHGLSILHDSATTGGTDKEEMIVAQKDLDSVMQQLEARLKESIAASLSKEMGKDYLILQDTLHFEMKDVEVNHHVDENATEISVKGMMVATGYYLIKNDLSAITQEMYLAQLPEKYRMYSKDIQISNVQTVANGKGSLQLNLTASGAVRPEIATEEIARMVKGQTVEYATNILRAMKDINGFSIPADKKSRLPRFGFGIRVVVRPLDAEKKGSI